MKQKVLLTVLGVSCLLVGAAGPASAQVSDGMMLKSDVPFAFVLDGRTIQAGLYSIEIRHNIVQVLDANYHPVQRTFSNKPQSKVTAAQPRLVFHRYGEKYFLWQVWSRDYKVDFGTSRAERILRASLKPDQETVMLALR
jgi:hypothetical protein